VLSLIFKDCVKPIGGFVLKSLRLGFAFSGRGTGGAAITAASAFFLPDYFSAGQSQREKHQGADDEIGNVHVDPPNL
jgi:hypothetical protein